MAVVHLTGNNKHVIKAEVGSKVWEVMNAERDGSEAEQAYCADIERLYLNWRSPTVPDSYVEANFTRIAQLHFGDWMCDGYGRITKPDPAIPDALEFAKKWGLYEHGQPTKKALDLIAIYQQPNFR